jgi:hypothetical protein
LQFGRRPQDIAFAAGNREAFIELHTAAGQQPAAEDKALPNPEDFWKYIEDSAGKVSSDADVPLPPERKGPALPGSRQEFEKWLGGVLFPQRAKQAEERLKKEAEAAAVSAGAPYARMNAPVIVNPPRMRPTRPVAPTVGTAGGSQFAARRQQLGEAKVQAANQPAGKPQDAWGASRQDDGWAAQGNVQTSLEPYGGPSAQPDARANVSQQAPYGSKPNPIGGLVQAIANKAQQDIKTTVQAAGNFATQMQQQQAAKAAAASAPKPAYNQGVQIALLREQWLLYLVSFAFYYCLFPFLWRLMLVMCSTSRFLEFQSLLP